MIEYRLFKSLNLLEIYSQFHPAVRALRSTCKYLWRIYPVIKNDPFTVGRYVKRIDHIECYLRYNTSCMDNVYVYKQLVHGAVLENNMAACIKYIEELRLHDVLGVLTICVKLDNWGLFQSLFDRISHQLDWSVDLKYIIRDGGIKFLRLIDTRKLLLHFNELLTECAYWKNLYDCENYLMEMATPEIYCTRKLLEAALCHRKLNICKFAIDHGALGREEIIRYAVIHNDYDMAEYANSLGINYSKEGLLLCTSTRMVDLIADHVIFDEYSLRCIWRATHDVNIDVLCYVLDRFYTEIDANELLMCACDRGSVKLCRYAVEKRGADAISKMFESSNFPEVLILAKEYGASNYATLLDKGAENNNPSICKMAIEWGVTSSDIEKAMVTSLRKYSWKAYDYLKQYSCRA